MINLPFPLFHPYFTLPEGFGDWNKTAPQIMLSLRGFNLNLFPVLPFMTSTHKGASKFAPGLFVGYQQMFNRVDRYNLIKALQEFHTPH